MRNSCIGKSDFKTLEDTIDKAYYDRMHKKLQTPYAKKIIKIRSRTVEPVLGTLINFLNMKRVNTRGIKQATKHVLMAALCYNLKKYMKFKVNKVITITETLSLNNKTAYYCFKETIYGVIKAFLSGIYLLTIIICRKITRAPMASN